MRHIAIFGGTFDPIHNGHLRSAVEVREELAADELWLLPSNRPPLRDRPTASSEQRLAMVMAAVHGEPGVRVDARELLRDTPSYTVDTLSEIRAEVGEDIALTLVVGSDALNKLHQWHDWQRLLSLANILALGRPDYELQLDAAVADQLGKAACDKSQLGLQSRGGFCELKLVQLAISATDIRERLVGGQSVRYLLPDAVIDFINQQQLYRR
ncbi:nicotinate-nucleotide adenylyltransferase [Spongiibacter sp. KMU-158]|uniref:Probable nicotinate-nucleotide adenylyltransferase n=1 Tax=Spongiibacter pelagi TaxID=2760804 RepID=A0A927C316_9GAMM|nr:nicotinate-nucleotide adenylyltransferase [Spongiibacter pelagi]